jgi:hypothetical protein
MIALRLSQALRACNALLDSFPVLGSMTDKSQTMSMTPCYLPKSSVLHARPSIIFDPTHIGVFPFTSSVFAPCYFLFFRFKAPLMATSAVAIAIFSLLSVTFLFLFLTVVSSRRNRKESTRFFHPYTNYGGGGDKDGSDVHQGLLFLLNF